jgi:hypothetical protein
LPRGWCRSITLAGQKHILLHLPGRGRGGSLGAIQLVKIGFW